MDKLSTLPKLYSFWIATAGAAISAAPIDWMSFDWTAFDGKKAMACLVWLLVFIAGRLAPQPSVND